MSYITVDKLEFGYDKKAVGGPVSFAVDKQDYLCIVGENGAGKSTLMKTLLGLIPPINGNITYGDGLRDNEIGYLPQQTPVQKDFPASVREIVLSGCQGRCGMRPFYNKDEKEQAEKNMERLGISSLASRCYRELSGGQQQRVLLARALCATEKVLLMDEPVSGLDPKVTAELYKLISNLNKSGISIIMISHDINTALTYADHILHVGEQIYFGTKYEYIKTGTGKNFLANQKGGGKDVG